MPFPIMTSEMQAILAKRREAAAKDDDQDEDAVKPDDEMDSDEMSDADRKARGIAGKKSKRSIFRNIIAPDVLEHDADEEDQNGPRIADEGTDALNREFADAVLERIGAGNVSKTPMSPVPDAGAGQTWTGDTRDLAYRPQAFTEGDGRVGQEVRRGPFAPNLGAGAGSYVDREGGQPGEGDYVPTVSIPGGMRLMSPAASGLADVEPFKPTSSAAPVLKRRKVGVFKDAIFGSKGDQADGFLGGD